MKEPLHINSLKTMLSETRKIKKEKKCFYRKKVQGFTKESPLKN